MGTDTRHYRLRSGQFLGLEYFQNRRNRRRKDGAMWFLLGIAAAVIGTWLCQKIAGW